MRNKLFKRCLYKFPNLIISQCQRIIDNDTSLPRNEIRKIDKILKKKLITKRSDGLDEITHHNNINLIEIKEFLDKVNHEDGSDIKLQDIYNPKSSIKTFLPHNNKEIVSIVKIRGIASDGVGLAILKDKLIKVPKVCLGETVKVAIKFHHEFYAEGQVLEILNSKRDNSLVRCKHFDNCSGCQFQMIPYEDQLNHKRNTIQKAYRFFYPELSLPNLKVIESPLQYEYRTKITPHFFKYKGIIDKIGFESVYKNQHGVDVENCPIATKEINELYSELKPQIINKPPNSKQVQFTIKQTLNENNELVAVEGLKNLITERVNRSIFQYSSTCFFQTNNSILTPLFEFINQQIKNRKIENIIDTYCGVGLFGIVLSKSNLNAKVYGIEINQEQIKYAKLNAELNNLADVQFITGDASNIFQNLKNVQGKGSLVIIDPSRKGSNESFLKQLIEFEPDMIIYISCNVFTQARDLSMFNHLLKSKKVSYKIKEVIGFDFFPQTKHVETVAVLEKCNH